MSSRLRGYSSLLLLGGRQSMWMTGLPHGIGWKQVMVTNHKILHSTSDADHGPWKVVHGLQFCMSCPDFQDPQIPQCSLISD
jgi:hypothetical protein